MKKVLSIAICLILVCTFLASCGKPAENLPPEVGKWHGTLKLSDVSDQLSEEDKMIYTLIAGSILFEVDAEFAKDGTFTYKIDTDKLVEELTKTINSVVGFFIPVDVSAFVQRLIEAASEEVFKENKLNYAGSYTSENGEITAADSSGETMTFKISGDVLIQYDNGSEFIRFERVKD